LLKPKLLTIKEFTGDEPHTHDFDIDGKLFKVCPNCFTCDNIGIREVRLVDLNIKLLSNSYSRRDKKKAVHILCTKNGLVGEDKKIEVSNIMNSLKKNTDEQTINFLSERFNIQPKKIDILLYNVKIHRMLIKNEV